MDEVKVANNHLATSYFLFLGGGCQITWTAILNSMDYFSESFPFQNVSFKIPIAIYIAQFIVTLFMAKMSSLFSYTVRIIVPLIVVGLVLAFLPMEAALFHDTEFGFWLLITLVFIMGFGTNVCYSTIIGLTSQLPGKYTTLFLIGSGIAGLCMSTLRIIISFAFAGQKSIGVAVYFVVAALLLVWCGVLHMLFRRSMFFTEFMVQTRWSLVTDVDSEGQINPQESVFPRPQRDFATLFKTLKEIKLYVVLIMLTYIQLFTVFPGVAFAKQMPDVPSDVKIVSMNMVFSIFFLIGKKAGQYRHLYNKMIITVIVIFRFALVAFCVIQAATTSMPLFNTIWFGYLNLILLGFTNGFVTCALFILAPEAVEHSKKEVAGFVSVFALTGGIIIGTFTALLFVNIGVSNH